MQYNKTTTSALAKKVKITNTIGPLAIWTMKVSKMVMRLAVSLPAWIWNPMSASISQWDWIWTSPAVTKVLLLSILKLWHGFLRIVVMMLTIQKVLTSTILMVQTPSPTHSMTVNIQIRNRYTWIWTELSTDAWIYHSVSLTRWTLLRAWPGTKVLSTNQPRMMLGQEKEALPSASIIKLSTGR